MRLNFHELLPTCCNKKHLTKASLQDSLSLTEGNNLCMMADCASECRYATPQILDQLLAGESGVDVEDWQAYTLYKNCSEHNHVVKWFWEILQGYSQKQLQALLAFVTCSPVPPAGRLPSSLALWVYLSKSSLCLSSLPFNVRPSSAASAFRYQLCLLSLPFNVGPSSAALALQFQLCLVTLGLRAAL